MYENVISKFKNTEGWSKEINCNIGVKQGCPLSPTLFGIYIDKLEECLEKAGCVGPTLTGIVINLLLYADDIVLMARSPHDFENQLRILKDFFSNMGMTVNTNKTKVMIIKSNKIPYDTFVYDNNNLEEVNSYKYLGIDVHHVRQHRYSNRGRTPSVTTHITRSKINTPMFSRGETPTGKHPRPQPMRPLGAVY